LANLLLVPESLIDPDKLHSESYGTLYGKVEDPSCHVRLQVVRIYVVIKQYLSNDKTEIKHSLKGPLYHRYITALSPLYHRLISHDRCTWGPPKEPVRCCLCNLPRPGL